MPSNAQKECSVHSLHSPWTSRCWNCWAITEPSFTGKQSKPSSVPYLILAGQTLCPAAPLLSTWKNCPLQMGSSLTYQAGYWCSASGNWQSLQHQEYLTCRVSSRKQIKWNMTGLVIRVKIWDFIRPGPTHMQHTCIKSSSQKIWRPI